MKNSSNRPEVKGQRGTEITTSFYPFPKRVDQIIGYYEGENLIRPVFEALTLEEFRSRYPDRQPVLASHLAQDDDYVPDPEEEVEV